MRKTCDKKEVVVAGIPRSGTTYLFKSICGLKKKRPRLRDIHDSLNAIKTHGLCPPDSFNDPKAKMVEEHMKKEGKAIFVFGDPFYSIISTKLNLINMRGSFKRHAENCGYFGERKGVDIYTEDIFNHERMFDSWMGCRSEKVLCVKYELMCENRKYIELFLDRKIDWLPWQNRDCTKVNRVKHKLGVYESLRKKWMQAPSIKKG